MEKHNIRNRNLCSHAGGASQFSVPEQVWMAFVSEPENIEPASIADYHRLRTFGMEFCFMLVTIIATYFTLRLPMVGTWNQSSTTKRIDIPGSITLFVAVATPLFAINIGGDILPWNHPGEILLLCLSPLALALFYYVESSIAASPIVPMRFIRMPATMAVLACYFPIVCTFNQVMFNLFD